MATPESTLDEIAHSSEVVSAADRHAIRPTTRPAPSRVWVAGKYFKLQADRFFLKGISYGPFAENAAGEPLPEPDQIAADFARLQQLGANAIRVYSPPSPQLLDQALQFDLRVLVDVAWDKHRCFFEDWRAVETARQRVRETAQRLGDHPATLGISVVNEIPSDVVRFYGGRRVERLLQDLNDSVKQIAPDCLTTFGNFPTTEFLQPEGFDFCSFNVYLNNIDSLAAYLDRLQHIAGDRPLVLGEFGLDTIQEGEAAQAWLLPQHVRTICRHGLAGSFVFSFTDDWVTGGARVEAWQFGITRTNRSPKPALTTLQQAWAEAPFPKSEALPKASVVVCSYNGSKTLSECLTSLGKLNYPDYEVIVVDDGSLDETPQIIRQFPEVRSIRQENLGLSAARNAGIQHAVGDVVAYTDDDCVADEDWLRCLVQAMSDQGVDAIGGPNITPRSDGWAAQCVAVSPGNASHVMLDDQRAEHIPGCNMAFRRHVLVELGGFDTQFRQAGDDVDVCWRLIDKGHTIGYAPGAFVWHHRRETAGAYLKQQIGYGKAESILRFKHPQRFGILGRCSWHGRIYGSGAAGLPLVPERIYHGPFGSAPFQVIYRHSHYLPWACATWLEWHIVALFCLALAPLFWPTALISFLMWSGTAAVGVHAAATATLPRAAPWWCRPLTAALAILQPVLREWYRLTYDLRLWRPQLKSDYSDLVHPTRKISPRLEDLHWSSKQGRGREDLLQALAAGIQRLRWLGVYNNSWASWDIKLAGDLWHTLFIHTASEELAGGQRFTRARCHVRRTILNHFFSAGALLWAIAALVKFSPPALLVGLLLTALAFTKNIVSRRQNMRALTALVIRAGREAGLEPYGSDGQSLSRHSATSDSPAASHPAGE